MRTLDAPQQAVSNLPDLGQVTNGHPPTSTFRPWFAPPDAQNDESLIIFLIGRRLQVAEINNINFVYVTVLFAFVYVIVLFVFVYVIVFKKIILFFL